MESGLICECGQFVPTTEVPAGSTFLCRCGRTLQIPSARVRSETTEETVRSNHVAETLAPTPVFLRRASLGQPSRREQVMATLAGDVLWTLDTWRLQSISLRGLVIEGRRDGRELVLTPGSEPVAETLTLEFADAAEGERWRRHLLERQESLALNAPADASPRPEGVSLVRRMPEVPHEVVGRVHFRGPTSWAAYRGLQLRAGIRGADAVVAVTSEREPDLGWRARHASGLAIRVADPEDRNRLRLRWYAEEVGALVNRLLILLTLQALLLGLGAVFFSGKSGLMQPTGQTAREALSSVGQGLALVFAWPVVTVALLRVLRWSQLLRIAGLAVLAATTGRVLTAWLAHLLAVLAAGSEPLGSALRVFLDPFDIGFIIAGWVLCARAFRLADDARRMLPEGLQAVPPSRRRWALGLMSATALFAVGMLGLAGYSRFEASTYLLQPGIDAEREQQALLAFNEGLTESNAGRLAAAEQAWQRSLKLWEELTRGGSAPPTYRVNLALTLNNLGWLRDQQGRGDEAQAYWARAVTVADELAGTPGLSVEFNQTMAGARASLEHYRTRGDTGRLDEKERAGRRRYEEAEVLAQKGEADAERLYREAIALWEEVLPHAIDAEYRKSAVARLASTHLLLGEFQQRLGQRAAAEATLKKGIDYGEQALILDPDRPITKHNLALARAQLEALREQAVLEKHNELLKAERYADALDLCSDGIEELERRIRSGQDRETAEARLAAALSRLAWFLAHCPDARIRDTKAAVKHADRTTQLRRDVGDYWYTLAMVQYRNGDWRDSLKSLDQLKNLEGQLSALDWLLVAMNRHRLQDGAAAREAMRKANEWVEAQMRQAEGNALLRFQFELQRPTIDSLRREAERLLEGKDPAGQGIG